MIARSATTTLVLSFLCAALAAGPALAQDRFVATGGSDAANDCSNAGTPCATIAHAISQAAASDVIDVAAGTYTEVITVDRTVTIQGAGAGATIVQAAAAPGLVGPYPGRVFTINDTGISLRLEDLTVRHGNVASSGGGIFLPASSALFLERVHVTLNHATLQGGGIHSVGFMAVAQSAITANTSSTSVGGGLYHETGFAGIQNTTISGNTALAGGGMRLGSGTSLLLFTTVAANHATAAGGGLSIGAGTLDLTNTLVAGNTDVSGDPDCSGSIDDAAYSLIAFFDGGCSIAANTATQTNVDPLLGALNSEDLPYHLPTTYASPALDVTPAGVGVCNATIPTDQRGEAREVNANTADVDVCDVGAVEVKAPVVAVAKTAPLILTGDADADFEPGERLRYSIDVDNGSEAAIEGVTLTDVVDPLLTYFPASITLDGVAQTDAVDGDDADFTGATVTVDLGSLAAGAGATVTFDATLVNPVGAGIVSVDNTAQVDVATPLVQETDLLTTPIVAAPALTAVKTHAIQVDADGDGEADPGETVRYTVVITNDGNQDATTVTFTDVVGAGQAYVPGSITLNSVPMTDAVDGDDADASGGTITVAAGTVAGAGGTATITFDVMIDDPFPFAHPAPASVSNQGSVTAGNHAPIQTNNLVVPIPYADLALLKWADRYRRVEGETVNFTVRLTNNGPDAAGGIEVDDVLSAGLVYVSSTATHGSYNNGTGVWTVGTLADGETAFLTVRATVAAGYGYASQTPANREVDNAAAITATDKPDPDATNDADDALVNDQDFDDDGLPNTIDPDDDNDGISDEDEGRLATAAKTAAPNANDIDGDGLENGLDLDSDGDGISDFQEGDADTDGDGVPDYLDPDSDGDGIPDAIEGHDADFDGVPDNTPLGFDSDGDGIDDGYDTVVGPDPSGTNAVLQNRDGDGLPDYLDPDDDNDGVPTAEEAPGDANTNGIPNYLDAATTIALTDADLSIEKTVDDLNPLLSETVVYTLTVTNNGAAAVNAIEVTDILPPGLKDPVGTPSQGTYYADAGLWLVGSLAGGASASLDIEVVVTGSLPIENEASISQSIPADPDASDNTDAVTIIPREQTSFWTNANTDASTVSAIAYVPGLPSKTAAASGTVFIGSDGGGVHRSTDGGVTWLPTTFTTHHIRELVVDNETTPGPTLYAATYDDGLYALTDYGLSSSHLFDAAEPVLPAGFGVDELLSVAVNNAAEKNAGAGGDLFVGTDGSGVFFSSDNGATWLNVTNNLPAGNARYVRSIVVDPGGGVGGFDRVYIGTHGKGVWYFDYTAAIPAPGFLPTWAQANGTNGALQFAVIHEMALDGDGDLYAGTNTGLYKASDPVGGVWTQSPDVADAVVRSILAYTAGPTRYVLAGTDGDYLYRSDDDGVTFDQIVRAAPNVSPWWGLQGSTILTLARDGDGVLFAGTQDYGLHRSTDQGLTWNQVTDVALVTVIQDMTFNADATLLFGGTQGHGVIRSDDFSTLLPTTNSPIGWYRVNSGLGNLEVHALLDYVRGGREYLFAGTWGGGVYRSVDTAPLDADLNLGAEWSFVGLGDRVVYDLAHCPAGDRQTFAATDRGEVARSVDNGLTWQEIGVANTAIWSLFVHPGDCQEIYAGTFGAGIYKSVDGGISWDRTGMTSGYAFDFAFDDDGGATGGERLWVATATGVQYSDDGGATWHDFSTGLTVRDVRALLFFETAGGTKILLAGTWGGGVFIYDEASSSWIRDGLPSMPTAPIMAFAIHPSGEALLTMNDGRIFRKEFPKPKAGTVGTGTETTEVPANFVLEQNYPNPFNPQTTIAFGLPEAAAVRLTVYDVLGREVAVLVDGTLAAGRHEVTFEAGTRSSGVYFYQLEAGGQVFGRKMLLMK